MNTVNIYLGNAFSIWDLIVSIAAAFALGLSVYLAVVEYHRYHVPLQMKIKEMILVDSKEDTYLVLLLLAFVNPASRGKTVFQMRGGAPNSINFAPSDYQFDEGQNKAVFQLPNGEIQRKVPVLQLLLTPLDIPPHQSQTKWYPALIRLDEKPKDMSIALIPMRLYAYDIFENEISKYEKEIELKTQMLF